MSTTSMGSSSPSGARPASGSTPPAPSGGQSAASALPTPSVAQPAQVSGTGQAAPLVSEITRIFSDDVINSVIVLATPEDYETIKETIAKIDITPRQVVIEGVIASIILQDELTLGLAYSLKFHVGFWPGGLGGNVGLNGDTLASASTTTQAGSGFNLVGSDDKGVVRAYVNALASDSKAKVLAAPHILVSDNRGSAHPGRAAGADHHFRDLRLHHHPEPEEHPV